MVHQITMKLVCIYYENKQTKNEAKHNKKKRRETFYIRNKS